MENDGRSGYKDAKDVGEGYADSQNPSQLYATKGEKIQTPTPATDKKVFFYMI